MIGHDMRALMHMVRCVVEDKIQDIYFPLVCTVDFRGFRIYGALATHLTRAHTAHARTRMYAIWPLLTG
jgi:hypothetical protein